MSINFGEYMIADAVTHYFEKEPEWWWKFEPVTAGKELNMTKFLAHKRIVQTPEGRQELPPTSMEIAFREVSLTFGGTNIEHEGKPIIELGDSVENIESILATMPRELFLEIWHALGKAYPSWGPVDPNGV